MALFFRPGGYFHFSYTVNSEEQKNLPSEEQQQKGKRSRFQKRKSENRFVSQCDDCAARQAVGARSHPCVIKGTGLKQMLIKTRFTAPGFKEILSHPFVVSVILVCRKMKL